MKKMYIRPASETLRLETEGTATGNEALTDRKTGMWDSDLWGTQE